MGDLMRKFYCGENDHKLYGQRSLLLQMCPRAEPSGIILGFGGGELLEWISRFKVCKSVHHPTIQTNHQPDATIFQFIILTFIYSSTCFGHFPAHHRELDCSANLWFYLRIVVTVVLCSHSTTVRR